MINEMDRANRIQDCLALPDVAARTKALRRMRAILTNAPLSLEERKTLFVALEAGKEPAEDDALWRLALLLGPDEQLAMIAHRRLEQPSSPNRELAYLYISRSEPGMVATLARTHAHDPSPEVRYQVAQYLRERDPRAGLEMMISLIPEATSHSLYDSLLTEIVELGTPELLLELHRLMQDPVHGGAYGPFATALEARLRRDGRLPESR